MKTPHVSAIIPTYNGRHLLEKHLPSVLKSLRNGDELVIVDDASSDDTQAWLGDEFGLTPVRQRDVDLSQARVWHGQWTKSGKKGSVFVVCNEKNVRFAEASNRGAKVATGQYFFLLNNDVEPHSDALTQLLSVIAQPNVFGVGCRERQVGADGVSESGRNELWFAKGIFQHRRAPHQKSGETAWISGGSGLFDAEKWRELGGFDVKFAPAYWEDIDLSERARRKGWKVVFEASAVVDHLHETTNSTVFGQRKIAAMSWRNTHRFTWKHGTLLQRLSNLWWRPYWWYKRWRNA
jgi:GT2 family glycosyltransferase